MRRLSTGLTIAMGLATAALAQPAPEEPVQGDTAPVDYARPGSWLCRPGLAGGPCAAPLDAVRIAADGTRASDPVTRATAPAIDCFYVYPTTSRDRTFYSDLDPDEAEFRTAHAQFARFGQVCRTFAPLYHQLTLTHLRWRMAHPGGDQKLAWDIPYRDVRDAWLSYLARDNKGRGVVLIGHSQGSILLKRLIAEEIDGKPAGKRIVAAYLAGNPDLDAGSFRTLPPCRAAGQTGCVVAWSSYPDDALAPPRVFGHGRPGQTPLCVNPAAPGGGTGMLRPVFDKPEDAPAADPPFVEPVDQLTARCVTDAAGAVLAVHIAPGRHAGRLEALFARYRQREGWGIHALDINLVEGNLLDLMRAQQQTWLRLTRRQ